MTVSKTLVIDTTPPIINSVTSNTADGSYRAGDLVALLVNFSEAVTVTGMPQLTLETGEFDRVIDYTNGNKFTRDGSST